MPRLPDITGARRTPGFQRSISTVRNAGAVANAAGAFGAGIADMANKALERQDTIAAASAKVSVLRESVLAKEELAQTPDYEKWLGQFDARMSKARTAAAKSIGSRSQREAFDLDIEQALVNSRADLSKAVFGRRASDTVAKADATLGEAQDGFRDAVDDATRTGFVESVSTVVQGLVDSGYISAEEGRLRTGKWVSSVSLQRAQVLKDAGDLDGARLAFERSRKFFDADTEMRFEAQLQDAEEGRRVITQADSLMAELRPAATPKTTTPAVAGSASRMVAITAETESNNRDFRADGSYVTSPKGARGRMQVMPGTQRDPGFGVKPAANDSAEELARVGRDYLQAMMRRYGGDPAKAWAAYNGGPGRVDDAIAKGGDWLSRMPGETRAYVAKNMKALGGDAPTVGDAGQQYDLGTAVARVNELAEENGWTPEFREKLIGEVERRISREDRAIKDAQDDAYDVAMAKAVSLGESFTDPSQLGDEFYRASPVQRRTLQGMAETNRKVDAGSGEPKANSPTAFALDMLILDNPRAFASEDLSRYFPGLTAAERIAYSTKQKSVAASLEGWTPYNGINAAVSRAVNFGGMKLDDRASVAVRQIMQGEAERLYKAGKGRQLTDKDFDALFQSATRGVRTSGGFLKSSGTRPRYELKPGDKARGEIEAAFRKINGRDPTEDETLSYYRRVYVPK